MISLTEKAISEVKRIIGDQQLGLDEINLRLGVSGGGCSGFSYLMTFDKEVKEDDETASYGELQVLMSTSAAPYIGNVVLDFNDDVNKRGFEFNNPDADDTCGCGNSFSV
ncbi:MAG: iron-sulfur cluster assembly protein [Pseudohongiellaceae bacterium]|jgi:iron-sulfur cluster assembly protein